MDKLVLTSLRWTSSTRARACEIVTLRQTGLVYVRGEGQSVLPMASRSLKLAAAQYPAVQSAGSGRAAGSEADIRDASAGASVAPVMATAVIEAQGFGLWRDLPQWRRRGWAIEVLLADDPGERALLIEVLENLGEVTVRHVRGC